MTDHRIIFGDALEVLRTLPAESIDCCITSPPYWGLRSYSDDPRELGKEATPEEYVERLVAVFAEVRRVLKPAGTVALNLGDSYASGKGTCYNPGGGENSLSVEKRKEAGAYPLDRGNVSTLRESGLKPKDLCMIPARVALALQADGWYLRSDMIWAKGLSGEATRDPDAWCGSVMPESVTDRPTQAHEHIFLLSKQPRYWYDHHAVREEGKYPAGTRAAKGSQQRADTEGVNARPAEYAEYSGTRNLRNVITVSPRGFSGAHFAVFPVELPLMLLPAICPPKVCSECGVAYEHRVDASRTRTDVSPVTKKAIMRSRGEGCYRPNSQETGGVAAKREVREVRDLGYHATCACNAPAIPGTVIDPFAGSATVAQAARKLGRRSIGIELNPEYEAVVRERLDLPVEGTLFADEDLGVDFATEEVAISDAN